MSHNSYGMGQDQITNTSKFIVIDYNISMGVLQERSYTIDHIGFTSWDIKLAQEL